jgi:hypothetical protein
MLFRMKDEAFNPQADFVDRIVPEFWQTYYTSLRRVHEQEGRELTDPIRDRNLSTTDSGHVKVLEYYCRERLANHLGVSINDVGKRQVRLSEHKTKSFDVCWPLKGDPKILISVKSMQNAYRNLTNRIEEAFGDSAVLRFYKSKACFGFFFFIVDGPVARGTCEQADPPERLNAKGGKKQTKGAKINLALAEDGGDFFDTSRMDHFKTTPEPVAESKKKRKKPAKGRKDQIASAQHTLIDLKVCQPTAMPTIHYDALAFVPVRISRIASNDSPLDWKATCSEVDPRIALSTFFDGLIETAKLRRFIDV